MEKRTTSIEKSTVFTQITRGVFVRLVAFSIRVLIVFCVMICRYRVLHQKWVRKRSICTLHIAGFGIVSASQRT